MTIAHIGGVSTAPTAWKKPNTIADGVLQNLSSIDISQEDMSMLTNALSQKLWNIQNPSMQDIISAVVSMQDSFPHILTAERMQALDSFQEDFTKISETYLSYMKDHNTEVMTRQWITAEEQTLLMTLRDQSENIQKANSNIEKFYNPETRVNIKKGPDWSAKETYIFKYPLQDLREKSLKDNSTDTIHTELAESNDPEERKMIVYNRVQEHIQRTYDLPEIMAHAQLWAQDRISQATETLVQVGTFEEWQQMTPEQKTLLLITHDFIGEWLFLNDAKSWSEKLRALMYGLPAQKISEIVSAIMTDPKYAELKDTLQEIIATETEIISQTLEDTAKALQTQIEKLLKSCERWSDDTHGRFNFFDKKSSIELNNQWYAWFFDLLQSFTFSNIWMPISLFTSMWLFAPFIDKYINRETPYIWWNRKISGKEWYFGQNNRYIMMVRAGLFMYTYISGWATWNTTNLDELWAYISKHPYLSTIMIWTGLSWRTILNDHKHEPAVDKALSIIYSGVIPPILIWAFKNLRAKAQQQTVNARAGASGNPINNRRWWNGNNTPANATPPPVIRTPPTNNTTT